MSIITSVISNPLTVEAVAALVKVIVDYFINHHLNENKTKPEILKELGIIFAHAELEHLKEHVMAYADGKIENEE